MHKPSFRAAVTALAGILIAIGGCSENPSSPVQQEFVTRGSHARFSLSGTASAVIDSRGGTLVTEAGDRIVFPAGALAEPTAISIKSDDTLLGVELNPHGLRFPAGRQPVLMLNTAGSNTASFKRVDVAYVDESGSVSEILPASTLPGVLATNLAHFSGYTAISH
jgi:hypothetical protein